jgi:hypothetical protein
VNKRTEFVGGLRRLATNIKSIEYYHTAFVWAGRHAMNEGRSFFDVVDHPDVKAWRQFKDDIVAELDAAVKIGLQYQCDLLHCQKLAVDLSQGYKEGLLLVEAITEATLLANRLEFCDDDPWVKVELKDIKINRSTVGRHIEKHDHIKSDEADGYYQIRRSKLYMYLTPPMVRFYLG